MPIKLIIHKEVILPDYWASKEEWDMLHSGELDGTLMDLLNEDVSSIIEECGGLEGLIQSMEWVEKA